MVEAARAAYGPIDIVIANAGLAESAPAGKIDLDHWQRALDVNLTGAFLTVKAALADVTRAEAEGARRIVFVASTAGLKGYPYVAAYCAAKHGVVGLMRALSVELAGKGVTVNAVCPGYTETPLLDAAVDNIAAKTGRAAAEARATLAKDNSHGRLITPEEIAAAVLWLCSPAAGSVNGQAIAIAGGSHERRDQGAPARHRAFLEQAAAAAVAAAVAGHARHRGRIARAPAPAIRDHACRSSTSGGAGAQARTASP